jgi:formylglycine-generating enzyme required for sulfatase activity
MKRHFWFHTIVIATVTALRLLCPPFKAMPVRAHFLAGFVLLLLLLEGSAPGQQTGEPRLALVMGVGDYSGPQFHALPGIENDLHHMEAALKSTGFTVTVVTNPTVSEAEDAIENFGTKLKAQSGGVGLFYFSGHGGEFEGQNYLIPKGARIGNLRDIKQQAVAAQRVLNRMEDAGTRVNIVFLDCCRNDLTKGKGATDNGLAPMSAKGTFIGFATGSEKTSLAGTEGSPYTNFLARRLLTPGISISDMHTQVTADVEDYTKDNGADEQTPFQYSGLRSNFYFVPGQGGDGTPSPMARLDPIPPLSSVPPVIPKAEPVLPAVTGKAPEKATKKAPYVNSLGMEFVPVPGTSVLFCRTDGRVRAFRRYATAAGYHQIPGAMLLKPTPYSPTWFLTAWQADLSATWEQPGFKQGEDHPVVCVNWHEARAFCEWLSAKEGRTYRLPTDAEYSAAVGTQNYPWGNEFPPPKGTGNYADESFNKSLPGGGWPPALANDGYARTSPAGKFPENRLGLYDIGGNVWQWCEGEYRASMLDQGMLLALPALRNEKAPDGTPLRVIRGGSWAFGDANFLRSSTRFPVIAEARGDATGFRCVLVLGSH